MLSYQFTDIVICLLSSLLKYAAARINDGNLIVITVSTRSRAEAAATKHLNLQWQEAVSTHSRAEAAAKYQLNTLRFSIVSTHSRAEAAAYRIF